MIQTSSSHESDSSKLPGAGKPHDIAATSRVGGCLVVTSGGRHCGSQGTPSSLALWRYSIHRCSSALCSESWSMYQPAADARTSAPNAARIAIQRFSVTQRVAIATAAPTTAPTTAAVTLLTKLRAAPTRISTKSNHQSTPSVSTSHGGGYTVPLNSHGRSGLHASGHRFKRSRGAGGNHLVRVTPSLAPGSAAEALLHPTHLESG